MNFSRPPPIAYAVTANMLEGWHLPESPGYLKPTQFEELHIQHTESWFLSDRHLQRLFPINYLKDGITIRSEYHQQYIRGALLPISTTRPCNSLLHKRAVSRCSWNPRIPTLTKFSITNEVMLPLLSHLSACISSSALSREKNLT
jgi:hypothetical protein